MADITPWVILLGLTAVIAIFLWKFGSLQRTVTDMDGHVKAVTDPALTSLKIAMDQTNADANKARADELSSRQTLLARMDGYEKAAMIPVETMGGVVKSFQDNVGTTVAGLQQEMGTMARGTQDRLTAFDSSIKDIRVEVEKIVNETGKFGELTTMTKQVHDLFVGAPTKGKAGEEVLKKMLDVLIEIQLVKLNQPIGEDRVEFAVSFPDKKLMPIDATVRCTKELSALSDEKLSPGQRIEYAKAVRKEVQGKIETVRKYIKPPITVEHAIVAVPDGAMDHVSDLTSDALEKGVFLVRFSAIAPFVKLVSYVYSLYVVRGDATALQEKISMVEHEISRLDNHFFSANFYKPLGKMQEGVSTMHGAVRVITGSLANKSGKSKVASDLLDFQENVTGEREDVTASPLTQSS